MCRCVCAHETQKGNRRVGGSYSPELGNLGGAPSQGALEPRQQKERPCPAGQIGGRPPLPVKLGSGALWLLGWGTLGSSPGGRWALGSDMGSHCASCSFAPPAASFSLHGNEAAWFTPPPAQEQTAGLHPTPTPACPWGSPPSQAATS